MGPWYPGSGRSRRGRRGQAPAANRRRGPLSYRVFMILGVNTTDASPAPVEDAVDIPASWLSEILDRRGRGAPRPVEIEPDAAQRLQSHFARHEKEIENTLARLTDPAFEAPIRARQS